MVIDKLSKLIEKHQDKIEEEPRDYIGASSIGSECLRQIWYQYKGYKSEGISAKTRRTWAIGKWLEQAVHEWLFSCGVIVWRNYPELVHPEMNFFRGNVDGVIVTSLKDHTPKYILEIKTAKDASFNMFIKQSVNVWNPRYYAQIQSYMGMSGIDRAYILVLNKDNSDLSDELVDFDEEYYKKLEEKALMISSSPFEPPRISNSPLWFKCKMCSYREVCHK